MKKHSKLFISLIFILLMCILPLLQSDSGAVSAGGLLQKVDRWSTLFPSDYGWSYRFIPGVTSVSYGGFTNDPSLSWHGSYSSKQPGIWSPSDKNDFLYINLLNCTKGSPWVRYNNVGTYKGQTVDLRITLMDWQTHQSAEQTANGDVPTVLVNMTKIAIAQSNYTRHNNRYKVELLQGGTNILMPSDLKYHYTLKDMDGGNIYGTPNPDGSQRSTRESLAIPENDFDAAYIVSTNNALTSYYSGNDIVIKNITDSATSDDDLNGQVTLLMSGSSFMYTYNTDLIGDGYNSRSFFNYVFSGDAIAGFDSAKITKTVSKSKADIDETFDYSLDFTLPNERADFKYPIIRISDTLASCLTLNGNVTVIDDAGTNRTSEFNVDQDANGKIECTAKKPADSGLYGKSYKVAIPVKIKDEYKDLKDDNGSLLSFSNNNGTIVSNEASLLTRSTISSNTVSTKIKYKITSSAVNGTITLSQQNLEGKKNYTYDFTPASSDYELESVVIDGVDRTSEFPNVTKKNSYTFKELHADHHIDVKFKRVFKIETDATGGTITSTITNIDKGENRIIHYQADAGNYLRRLTVDGVEVDLKKYPTEYSFKNIDKDYAIKAEFLPIPKIEITKKIYVDEIYFASGNPTFIYELKGTDYLGDAHMYYETITFTEADVKNAKTEAGRKVLEKTIKWDNINAGTYQAKESSVSRYHLKSITDITSGTLKGNVVEFNTDNHPLAKATFINERLRYQKFSHNDLVIDTFSK